MCIDTIMVAEGRRRKLVKKRLLYVNLVKAALRKYVEGKRVKSHSRLGRTVGPQQQQEASRPERPDRLPSGAMAPRNTTQYLMELAYSERGNVDSTTQQRLNDVERRSADVSRQRSSETTESRESRAQTEDNEHFFHFSLYSDDENMDFQQRDFENVYFLHEL